MLREALNHSCIFLAICISPLSLLTAQQVQSDTMVLQQCEPDSCGTWSFHGKQGVGKWLTGPVANLIIERFDEQSLSIRREDTGGSKGLKGRYTGTRKGNHIEGTFTWTWPGGPFPSGTVDWIATIDDARLGSERPSFGTLAVCEEAADGCSNWSFRDREGYANWSNCVAANLTVIHYDGENVVIRRIDVTGDWQGLSALYTGVVAGDQIKGAMTWLWQGHGQYTIGTVPWHATIGAVLASYKVPVDKAMGCGAAASSAHNYVAASHWYLYAEREGSVRASQDYPNALKRFESAGNYGDTLGMNNAALMYQRGLGVAVSPERVKYWVDRMAERRQQFYSICSNKAVRKTMEQLLADSRSSPGSLLGALAEGLIAEGMHIDLKAPDIHVAAARTTDVVSENDFKCDGVFAPQSEKLIQPTREADADIKITALLANQMMKNLQPIQEYHLIKTGASDYVVLLEAVGSEYAQNGMRLPLPKVYSRQVSLR